MNGSFHIGFNDAGMLQLRNNATVSATFGALISVDGRVTGVGTITNVCDGCNVRNAGVVTPGDPTGVLNIVGDYTSTIQHIEWE